MQNRTVWYPTQAPALEKPTATAFTGSTKHNEIMEIPGKETKNKEKSGNPERRQQYASRELLSKTNKRNMILSCRFLRQFGEPHDRAVAVMINSENRFRPFAVVETYFRVCELNFCSIVIRLSDCRFP